MELLREDDTEYLANLEQRILKAVELVTALKKENEALKERLSSATADRSEVEGELSALRKEVESLRGERKQVRTRIEKLLGQMDLLSA